ncbi:MAG: winged helix DNA-binding domain-containing protein [Chloroflexota bacterium]
MNRPPTLSPRRLNRALLARQLLLERSNMSVEDAIDAIGGMQTQYAPSGYVGLWTRLAHFERDALTRTLEDRSVVQATLLRTTIHMVTSRAFWLYAIGIRDSRRRWAIRVAQPTGDRATMEALAGRVREALAAGPRHIKELGPDGAGFLGNLAVWVDLVRVPPSGTWDRRRADILAVAEDWIGPTDVTESDGLAHLVLSYLRAFGPAPWRDIAGWAGISVADARRGGENLTLVHFLDVDGRPLIDLPDAALPDEDVAAPVRFLAHWDAVLLVHAGRTGILPESHRTRIFNSKNPFSVGTILVDGHVAGTWWSKGARIEVDILEPVRRATLDEIEAERIALEAFYA